MSKRQARFEQLRESSMERIENAAMELFARNGYGHTSISQIAKAAGISKGLMYNYYESKEALLQAILKRGFDMGNQLIGEGMEQIPDDPVALLKYLVHASFGQVQSQFEYFKLLTSLAFQKDVVKEVKSEIDQMKEQHLAMGAEIFRQLGYPEPKEQALLFAAAMDGVFLHYMVSPSDYPLEKMKAVLIGQFCKKYEK